MIVPFPGAATSGTTPHYGLIDFQAEQQEQQQQKSPPAATQDGVVECKPLVRSESLLNSDIKLQPLASSMLFDLELMHHYTRHTYLTVTDLEDTMPTWQDAMPKAGLTHPFLMHGVLALAAFHIAVLEPGNSKIYIDRGMQHYTQALTLYRVVLTDTNRENCHALFAFSSLGAIISFAVSMVSRHTHDAITKDILDTFSMLRGIHIVVLVTREWIQYGPMASLLRMYVVKPFELPDACKEYLTILEDRVIRHKPDEEGRRPYLQAIEVGRNALKNIGYDPEDKTLAFTWPIMVSRPYIDALHDRKPLAMAILGLYGVILYDVRNYWWAEDLGTRLIQAVSVALDDTWEETLRYPLSLIGLSSTVCSTSYPSSTLERPSFSPPQISPGVKFENIP